MSRPGRARPPGGPAAIAVDPAIATLGVRLLADSGTDHAQIDSPKMRKPLGERLRAPSIWPGGSDANSTGDQSRCQPARNVPESFREGPYGDYKWLDLLAFCSALLPRNRIDLVRYFTARVKPEPFDITKPARQAAYINALRTLPEITIHMGTFSTHPKVKPVAEPARHCQTHVRVPRCLRHRCHRV